MCPAASGVDASRSHPAPEWWLRKGWSPGAPGAVADDFGADFGLVAFFLPQFPMGPGSDGPMGGMGGMEPHHMNGSLGERPRRGLRLGDVLPRDAGRASQRLLPSRGQPPV